MQSPIGSMPLTRTFPTLGRVSAALSVPTPSLPATTNFGPAVPLPPTAPGCGPLALVSTPKKTDLWREVTSRELFASALHLSPDRIRQAAGEARDVGHAFKDVWKSLSGGRT